MGRTYVDFTVTGLLYTRTYPFSVDTGSAPMGLQLGEVEVLGSTRIPNGQPRFLTATEVVELDTYGISGRVLIGPPGGKGFVAMVAPASIPLIGYERLQNMKLRVNPVSEQLEEVPDEAIDHPPYLL